MFASLKDKAIYFVLNIKITKIIISISFTTTIDWPQRITISKHTNYNTNSFQAGQGQGRARAESGQSQDNYIADNKPQSHIVARVARSSGFIESVPPPESSSRVPSGVGAERIRQQAIRMRKS